MNRGDHEQLSELFLDVVDRPIAEREALLDRACANNPELRARIERLLRHHDAPPSFLKTVAPEEDGDRDGSPRYIGPYRILGRLGAGGMGVVYHAEQRQPIRRHLAVKLIRLGRSSPQELARFEAERQALALMNHPNIAQVFDAGATEDGFPYLAMEYVDGEPITEFCDHRRLTIEKRLELFRQVCQGVQHAHHNAIIHRDVKPSNVLVALQDGAAVPKLIDFGVAKAVDPSETPSWLETRAGQVLGTPAYMSPEQAESGARHIDTRTDVYSLGALLYELLVGRPPLETQDTHDIDEVRRRIRTEEPLRPSVRLQRLGESAAEIARRRGSDPRGLVRRIEGDLDWIVMRALDKNPNRRYGSPAELVADLDRHVGNEPVSARPPGLFYRAEKFVRKNRSVVAFAATLAMLLVGFAVTQTVQARRLANERDRANRQAATAEEVSEFLVQLLNTRSPLDVRESYESPAEVLESGLAKIDQLQERPVLHARVLLTVGRLYLNMGLDPRARPILERARVSLENQLGQDHPYTLEAIANLGVLNRDTGRFEEAEPLLTRAVAGNRRLLGEHHPTSIRAARDLALLYTRSGRYPEAEDLLQRVVADTRSLFGDSHPETLVDQGLLAGVQLELGRIDQAERELSELRPRLGRALGEDHVETLAADYNLACVHALRGRKGEAHAHLERAVKGGFFFSGIYDDPHLVNVREEPWFEELAYRLTLNVSWAWSNAKARVKVLEALGDCDSALALQHEVLDGQRRRLGADHVEALNTTLELAELYLSCDRYDEGEPLLLGLLGQLPQHAEEYPWLVSGVSWDLAECHARRGSIEKAASLIEEATVHYRRQLGDESPAIVFCQACLSALHGDRQAALELLSRAVHGGFAEAAWMERDFTLAALHGDPRFEDLLARVRRRRGPWSVRMGTDLLSRK